MMNENQPACYHGSMSNLDRSVATTLRLRPDESAALWNWLLGRQGLSEDRRFQSAFDVAHAALGLHAARRPSPFATVVARGAHADAAMDLFSEGSRQSLTTIRCMRKTLHTLPLGLAAAAHAATLHYRERDTLRALTNAGESLRMAERVIVSLMKLLAETGELCFRKIERRLVSRTRSTILVRLSLKLAWERGTLTYLNSSSGWNRENRQFALTAVRFPELDMGLARLDATHQLILAYFERYGPATVKDAMWWSALSRSAIEEALLSSGRAIVRLSTEWTTSPLYMFRDQFDEFRQDGGGSFATGLNFLAHEDVALKAYFESRTRYLSDLPQNRAFNQIGEALPTVLLNGNIIGTWAWDTKHRRVSVAIEDGYATTRIRAKARARAAELTDVLRLGWVE